MTKRTLIGDYVIDALAHFHNRPPLDEYEEGYFDAFAAVALHFNMLPDAPPKPSRPQFIVIQGGKTDSLTEKAQ